MSEVVVKVLRRNCRELKPIPTDLEVDLKPLPAIEAVMFDIYGTLFMSGSGDVGHASANPKSQMLADAFEASGITLQSSPEDYLGRYYDSIRQSHQRSHEAGIAYPEVDILEIWKTTLKGIELEDESLVRLAIEFESRSNPVWAMPELQQTLEWIAARKKMGIVSNAQFFTLDLFEALLGVDRLSLGFDPDLEVFSFAENQAKPGKTIFDIAVKRLTKKGIQPENVLYVGNDMLNDIRGAQLVGFRTALFAGDRRSLRLRKDDQRVDGIQPDIIVNCLTQITDCVE